MLDRETVFGGYAYLGEQDSELYDKASAGDLTLEEATQAVIRLLEDKAAASRLVHRGVRY